MAFWNLIGALGFTLSGIFGYYAFANKYQVRAEPIICYSVTHVTAIQKWGTTFNTFYGGIAFLIGSYCQLLEVVNKHPMPVPSCGSLVKARAPDNDAT